MDSLFDPHRTPQKKYPHWAVFETIVDDLHDYSRYVEFHAANFKTFSVHLTRLYLSICSEIDVVLKMVYTELGHTKKRPDINDYRRALTKAFPNFGRIRITIRSMDYEITPWDAWVTTVDKNPLWWGCYNKVKHERNIHFADANLENVLHSAAAFLVALMFLYKVEVQRSHLAPDFRIFGYPLDIAQLIRMGAHLEQQDMSTISVPRR